MKKDVIMNRSDKILELLSREDIIPRRLKQAQTELTDIISILPEDIIFNIKNVYELTEENLSINLEALIPEELKEISDSFLSLCSLIILVCQLDDYTFVESLNH